MNKILRKPSNLYPRLCSCVRDEVKKVVPHQAVSPAQMASLTSRGLAVSSPNAESFNDGTFNPSYDIPIEQRRGIDVNQVWEAQQSARKRLVKAHQTDKQLYDN